jgi:putative transposase
VPYVFPAILSATFKDRADLVAENLTLRHQLACFAKGRKRPKLRPVDRFLWTLLARWWSRWRDALVMVKPATVVTWHRKGFRLFWRWKSRPRRPGRPPNTSEVRKLIEEMAQTNVGWGVPRIHGELRKLGIQVSEATVSRYMPKRPAPPGAGQRWSAFLANHLRETLAIDFAVVPTITFGLMYVFFVLSLDRRRILHFNVTKHPTASWTAHQVVQACDFETPGRYLLRDNDLIYGQEFRQRMERLGLEQIRTALRSPWQNGYAERWVRSLRRDCLDHVIAINERQLRCVIREYVEYYHADRSHLGLDKDTPDGREFEPPEVGKIVALPRVGGLQGTPSPVHEEGRVGF